MFPQTFIHSNAGRHCKTSTLRIRIRSLLVLNLLQPGHRLAEIKKQSTLESASPSSFVVKIRGAARRRRIPPGVALWRRRPSAEQVFCFSHRTYELKMARLRFVGRPGRPLRSCCAAAGVSASKKDEIRRDDAKQRLRPAAAHRSADPYSRLLANVHRGLKNFCRLAGKSDEVYTAYCNTL